VGNTVLTAAAAVGIVCALAWALTVAGWIQPLVVVSGSMQPEIATGDLLVATRTAVGELEVGQVASLPSAVTGSTVTHRIIGIETTGPQSAQVRMRGDANEAPDGEVYEVEGTVWQPAWQVPGAGFVIATFAKPGVVIPLLVAIVALIGFVLVPSSSPRGRAALGPSVTPHHGE